MVNVDLFGEGFDLPAIGSVSFARPTQSFPLYAQQFGRSLRVLEGKDRAIVIDHVGNVIRHGLPDAYRAHTLDSRERKSGSAGVAALRARHVLKSRVPMDQPPPPSSRWVVLLKSLLSSCGYLYRTVRGQTPRRSWPA